MSDLWSELAARLQLDLLAYLFLAVLLGGAIGLEREVKGKPAGLRTNILICVGATLFTYLSRAMAEEWGDPTRIAAQIVTGVGFLGAGTILHSRGYVTGLTSAATIWLVAAIGMAVGYGAVLEAIGTTLLVFLVLVVLGRVEPYLHSRQEVSRVTIEVGPKPELVENLERVVRRAGLEIEQFHTERFEDKIVVDMTLRGARRGLERAKRDLLGLASSFTEALEE